MSLRQTIVNQIDKDSSGLEIGPGQNPIARKSDGYNVQILDFLAEDSLANKHKQQSSSHYEDVDFVWQGEAYGDLVGNKKYDWIVASHVIEHAPDLVAFLNNCADILSKDGSLYLLVPDKRYCFDHYRPISSMATVIDAHRTQHARPTLGSAVEQILYTSKLDGQIAWNSSFGGQPQLANDTEVALARLTDKQELITTLEDVHSWVFLPQSLRLLIEDLYSLNLIQLREDHFADTQGCEFFMSLKLNGHGPESPREKLLMLLDRELRYESVPAKRPRDFLKRIRALISP